MSRVTFSYATALLLWLVARVLIRDSFWPLALINTTLFFFLLPAPFLLLAALPGKRRRAVLPLLLPLGLLIYYWGGFFVPPPWPGNGVDGSPPLFTAMTFNVLFVNETPASLAKVIAAESPDIVGLQELAPPITSVLARDLPDYSYHTFETLGESGVGLLSRHPILTAERLELPPGPRGLHAVIDWNGRPVHVFVAHFSANNFFDFPLTQFPELAAERYALRDAQVTRLLAALPDDETPALLLCDCNLTDTSVAYGRLAAVLNDGYRAVGWGMGHTLAPLQPPIPIQRIDYVWHNSAWLPTAAHVAPRGGSDHHPVVVKFQLQR